MHTIGFRRGVAGAALAVAIVGASFSAVLFSRSDSNPAHKVVTTHAERATTTTSTTTSTTSTTTTTTTTLPPLNFAPDPAPAPAPQAPLNFAPAPEPAPDPQPTGCSGGGGVVGAHNADRAAAGLGGLCVNGQLSGFAQNWANQMASTGSLVHSDIGALIGGTDFSTMGENILVAPGNYGPGDMESAWMNSPSHRENILNGAFTQVGVGMAFGADGRVWVCVDFGG